MKWLILFCSAILAQGQWHQIHCDIEKGNPGRAKQEHVILIIKVKANHRYWIQDGDVPAKLTHVSYVFDSRTQGTITATIESTNKIRLFRVIEAKL